MFQEPFSLTGKIDRTEYLITLIITCVGYPFIFNLVNNSILGIYTGLHAVVGIFIVAICLMLFPVIGYGLLSISDILQMPYRISMFFYGENPYIALNIVFAVIQIFVLAWIVIQGIKRCNALGKPGWWILVPIFNPVLMLFTDDGKIPANVIEAIGATAKTDVSARLAKLKTLLDDGTITETEFKKKKKEILDDL